MAEQQEQEREHGGWPELLEYLRDLAHDYPHIVKFDASLQVGIEEIAPRDGWKQYQRDGTITYNLNIKAAHTAAQADSLAASSTSGDSMPMISLWTCDQCGRTQPLTTVDDLRYDWLQLVPIRYQGQQPLLFCSEYCVYVWLSAKQRSPAE